MNKVKKTIGYIFKIIRFSLRLCLDADMRWIYITQLTKGKEMHQTTTVTFYDRYPLIFKAVSALLADSKNRRILSYGCSTGEEVRTLRAYFPEAYIIGTDINKRVLRICKSLSWDDRTLFLYPQEEALAEHGPYDAIFCMAVLQRRPHYVEEKGIECLEEIYPFKKFEAQVKVLDRMLRTGGILVLYYTQYSFLDTEIAHKYRVIEGYPQMDYVSSVFDQYGKKKSDTGCQETIYQKTMNN